MADVFISYKREDRAVAEQLARALEQLGFDVWWDFQLLSGDKYRKVIREVIDRCNVAVVLWSASSVESDFVMDEAAHAKEQSKLCPARIDGVPLPFGFGQTHTDDLTQWSGEMDHPGFNSLLRSIEAKTGKKGRLGAKPRDASGEQAALELAAFKAAQLAGNAEALRTFLKKHATGLFADFVREQLEDEKYKLSSSPAPSTEPDRGFRKTQSAPDQVSQLSFQAGMSGNVRSAQSRKEKANLWPVVAALAILVVGGGAGWLAWQSATNTRTAAATSPAQPAETTSAPIMPAQPVTSLPDAAATTIAPAKNSDLAIEAEPKKGRLAADGPDASAPAASPASTPKEEMSAWKPMLRWPDGRELQWRSAKSSTCDGSNVELRLLNNSSSEGEAGFSSATFACARSGEAKGPGRALGRVPVGGMVSASVISCACEGRGGVTDVTAVDLEFLKEGPGSEVATNGCTYSGNFVKGQRSGKGVYSCTNGYRHEGVFLLGKPNGPAVETLGEQRYEGDFVDGLRQGPGKMTYSDGSVYEGGFKSGLRDGTGTAKFRDGSYYVGEWKADLRAGHGVYTSAGNVWAFDGEWVADERTGPAKLSFTDGSQVFEGVYRNGLRQGEGVVTFGDGRVFRGTFLNDGQDGPGVMTYPDGRRVSGTFRNYVPQ